MSKIAKDELEQILDKLMNRYELPTQFNLLRLIEYVKDILIVEPNLILITGSAYVYGDIHGQFYDLMNMEKSTNFDKTKIFLGDYVDRGYNSVETMLYLIIIKCLYKDKVFLLRGNHESRGQTAVYGFRSECELKYDRYIYWKFCEVFRRLPIAAIVNNEYFCVHGGIIPEVTIDNISKFDRFEKDSEIFGMLWSDPNENIEEEFVESCRGFGYLFNKVALSRFLDIYGYKVLVRSHQLVKDGYIEELDGRCITVWSAPNYCYEFQNKAAIMTIDKGLHTYQIFEALEEQYKDKDIETRSRLRLNR